MSLYIKTQQRQAIAIADVRFYSLLRLIQQQSSNFLFGFISDVFYLPHPVNPEVIRYWCLTPLVNYHGYEQTFTHRAQ